jgi:class 3 adenylate cyclase
LFFLTFITLQSLSTSAKEQEKTGYLTPRIQHYKLQLYHPDVPNISFHKDPYGTLYIGKESGLDIISGTDNIHLPMNGPVYVSGGNSDTIFYACENDFGYLEFGPKGDIFNLSLIQSFPKYYSEFYPSQLIQYDSSQFINAEEGVYRVSGNYMIRYDFDRLKTRLFPTENDLFLFVADSGIYRYTDSSFELCISSQQINFEDVASLIQNNQNINIITSRGNIWRIAPGSYLPVKTGSLSFEATVSGTEKINEERILLATETNGLYILDQDGNIINELGNRRGLPGRNIKDLLNDDSGGLWILSERALFKMDYPSGLSLVDIPESYGSILNSAKTSTGFYLGTQTGLYNIEFRAPGSDQYNIQELIPSDRESIHLFEKNGDIVFAAGPNSLYEVVDGKTVIIDHGSFSAVCPVDSNLLIASNGDGIIKYEKSAGNWVKEIIDSSIPYGHSFEKFNNKIYFLSTGFQVHFLNENRSSIYTHEFDDKENNYTLLKIEGTLFLLGESHIYSLDSSDKEFIAYDDLNRKSSIFHLTDLQNISDYTLIPAIKQMGNLKAVHLGDKYLWLTGERKIMGLERSAIHTAILSKSNLKYERIVNGDLELFRFVHPNGRTAFTEGRPNYKDDKVNYTVQYAHNQLEFYLSAIEYQTDVPLLYRSRLMPVEENWSEWSENPILKLNRLREGKYAMEVQSKDLYGSISESISFNFSVIPPIYRTWYAYAIYLIFIALFSIFLYKWRLLGLRKVEIRASESIQSQLDILSKEKAQSDKLIADILPTNTAAQLKASGRAKWDKYEMATVLFSDIQGFTKIAEEMNPEVLIDELDKFFFHFDSVVDKYNIEKIKTIGDAYMAAGGIPEKNSTNPVEVVLAALEMQYHMKNLKNTKADIWDLRIGIHSGPVIAGVVGHKKISYDIWGDTVNTASRMESSGIPGRVNISGITYSLVKDYFICEYRGKLPVKYKGNIDMYFVNGLRPELSIDLKGLPNRRFNLKLQMLKLNDLADFVFDEVLPELPPSMHFHSLKYVKKVYDQVFLICRSEEIDTEETIIVRTAALLCFSGLTQSYNNYENRSVVISRDILPKFDFSEKQIDQITNLILATKQPFNPVNILEKILIDAKMEYIGRPDFIGSFKLILVELKENNQKISFKEWKRRQILLLNEFRFFTLAGKRLRETSAEEQIEVLESEEWI